MSCARRARLLQVVRPEELQPQVIAHSGMQLDPCMHVMITGDFQRNIAENAQTRVTAHHRVRAGAGSENPGFDLAEIQARHEGNIEADMTPQSMNDSNELAARM